MKLHLGKKTVEIGLNDILFVTFTPALLTVLYFLPVSVKNRLIFEYANPQWTAAYTTQFMHLDFFHFLGNVVMAGILITFLSLTFSAIGEKQRFRRAYLFMLLLFPSVITGIDYLMMSFIETGIERTLGFSGMNMALVALLPIAVFTYLHKETDGLFSRTNAVYLFYFGLSVMMMSLLVVINKYNMSFSPLTQIGIIATFLFMVCYADYRLLNAIDNAGISVKDAVSSIKSTWHRWIALVVALYFLGTMAAVPTNMISEGGLVNIVGHQVGFVLGFFLGELLMWTEGEHLLRFRPKCHPV